MSSRISCEVVVAKLNSLRNKRVRITMHSGAKYEGILSYHLPQLDKIAVRHLLIRNKYSGPIAPKNKHKRQFQLHKVASIEEI